MARLIRHVALVAVATFSATPALAQRLGGGTASDISVGRIVAALVLCVIAAVLAILLLKRGGGRIDFAGLTSFRKLAVARRIDVVETRRISQHADLCLVRCDGQDYLILTAQGQQSVLREGPARCE